MVGNLNCKSYARQTHSNKLKQIPREQIEAYFQEQLKEIELGPRDLDKFQTFHEENLRETYHENILKPPIAEHPRMTVRAPVNIDQSEYSKFDDQCNTDRDLGPGCGFNTFYKSMNVIKNFKRHQEFEAENARRRASPEIDGGRTVEDTQEMLRVRWKAYARRKKQQDKFMSEQKCLEEQISEKKQKNLLVETVSHQLLKVKEIGNPNSLESARKIKSSAKDRMHRDYSKTFLKWLKKDRAKVAASTELNVLKAHEKHVQTLIDKLEEKSEQDETEIMNAVSQYTLKIAGDESIKRPAKKIIPYADKANGLDTITQYINKTFLNNLKHNLIDPKKVFDNPDIDIFAILGLGDRKTLMEGVMPTLQPESKHLNIEDNSRLMTKRVERRRSSAGSEALSHRNIVVNRTNNQQD